MKKTTAEKEKIKLYSFNQTFKKRSPAFKRGYKEESNRIALAAKIRELREGRKLTQFAVAKEAEMPQSVIARIESGEHSVSVDTLARVAHALGKKVTIA